MVLPSDVRVLAMLLRMIARCCFLPRFFSEQVSEVNSLSQHQSAWLDQERVADVGPQQVPEMVA